MSRQPFQTLILCFKSNQKLLSALIFCTLALGGLTWAVNVLLSLLLTICIVTLFAPHNEITKLQFRVHHYIQQKIETDLKRHITFQRAQMPQSCKDVVSYPQFKSLPHSVNKANRNINFDLLNQSKIIRNNVVQFMTRTFIKLACPLDNELVNIGKIESGEIFVKKSIIAFTMVQESIKLGGSTYSKSGEVITRLLHRGSTVSVPIPIECKPLLHLANNQIKASSTIPYYGSIQHCQVKTGASYEYLQTREDTMVASDNANFRICNRRNLLNWMSQIPASITPKINKNDKALLGISIQSCKIGVKHQKSISMPVQTRTINTTEFNKKNATIGPFPVDTRYQSQVSTYSVTNHRATSDVLSESSDQVPEEFSDVVIAAPGDLFLAKKIENIDKKLVELAKQQNSVNTLITEKIRINDSLEAMIKVGSDLLAEIKRLNHQKLQFESQAAQNIISPSNTKIAVPDWVFKSVGSRRYVSYNILVQRIEEDLPKAGWIVTRRYSEFFALHENLSCLFPDLCGALDFPSQWQILRFSKAFLEARRAQLEEYLQTLVENPDICKQQIFLKFLCKEVD